jgi:hypothetical protein
MTSPEKLAAYRANFEAGDAPYHARRHRKRATSRADRRQIDIGIIARL